ncbi:MAG: hypothetical protein HY592_02575 [Candidatus Omnitrophica bacterium]|nr:hypothetical protein [Candidatus Omnitrophota bacterium]
MIVENLTDINQRPELGQVWTPANIAEAMVISAFKEYGDSLPETVVDPACGPATFEIAMHRTGYIPNQILAIDCDNQLVGYTEKVANDLQLPVIAHKSDYLLMFKLKGTADIVIMNPPYIRHENLSDQIKGQVFEYLSEELDFSFDRRSNLYCYFLLKAILDLKVGGVLCAIVYDSLKNTMYGKRVSEILRQYTDLISSQNTLAPFQNVLVDAQILICRKRLDRNKKIDEKNEEVCKRGHTKLSDLLVMQRGTAIPFRKVFIAKPEDPYFETSRPFFAKQNKIDGLLLNKAPERCYMVNDNINPLVKRWIRNRLKVFGKEVNSINVRPVKGKILFNYYVRSRPRHLFNPTQIPVSDNFYVSEPINGFPAEAAWLLLNSSGYIKPILEAGRSQGSGLTKLQLFEYRNSIVPDWRLLTSKKINTIQTEAVGLLKKATSFDKVQECANQAYSDVSKHF